LKDDLDSGRWRCGIFRGGDGIVILSVASVSMTIIATISLPAMVKPIATTIAEKSSFNAPLRCSRRCDASVPMMQQRHREDRSTAPISPSVNATNIPDTSESISWSNAAFINDSARNHSLSSCATSSGLPFASGAQ